MDLIEEEKLKILSVRKGVNCIDKGKLEKIFNELSDFIYADRIIFLKEKVYILEVHISRKHYFIVFDKLLSVKSYKIITSLNDDDTLSYYDNVIVSDQYSPYLIQKDHKIVIETPDGDFAVFLGELSSEKPTDIISVVGVINSYFDALGEDFYAHDNGECKIGIRYHGDKYDYWGLRDESVSTANKVLGFPLEGIILRKDGRNFDNEIKKISIILDGIIEREIFGNKENA